MVFQVEITPTATAQIEKAYRWYRGYNAEFADRWFRGLMNAIATLQEKPTRCALALEQTIFLPKEVRQLFYETSMVAVGKPVPVGCIVSFIVAQELERFDDIRHVNLVKVNRVHT